MRTGRTLTSAKLHKVAGNDSKVIDELEPGYPLTIVFKRTDGWVKVIAKPKGKRDEAQEGYIWHDLIRWDEPLSRKRLPECALLRPAEWRVALIALGAALGAFAIYAWMMWG